jgi:integrase
MAKIAFTAGRVLGFKCPPDKKQAFLWDASAPGLGLRATPSGKPAYVFQGVYQGRDIRITIGNPAAWSIQDAREKARELQRLIDEGKDPRELKREAIATAEAQRQQEQAQAVTVGEVWPLYMEQGRPKRKDAWKPRYVADMLKMVAPGGEPKKRGAGLTLPGLLYPLLQMRLSDVNEDTLSAWFDQGSLRSKHQATRALMVFRGFLRWCSTKPAYRKLVDREAGKAAAIVENLPATVRRTDALDLAQMAGWWAGVVQLPNITASAYLRALLLTGARREELAALRWEDVEFRWRRLTIADKVGDTRTLPLSDYLAWLLNSLPRKGPYVFASASKSGRLVDARASHDKALQFAGIEHLTFHGLRRTFALRGESAGAPAGAIAQIMGHRPSATAEGYKPRTVDDLRPFMALIERHILDLAGVQFEPVAEPGRLRVVG